MRRGLIVTAVLGTGTGLVFSVAALAATLFPNGSTIAGGSVGWGPGGVEVRAVNVPGRVNFDGVWPVGGVAEPDIVVQDAPVP